MDLVEFLVIARRETYAIEHGDALGDGTEQMVWAHDGWRYQDRYAGSNPYGGHELVWHDARVVWMMNYHAEVVAQRSSMSKIYAFQREVLGQPDREHLMRGPARYTRGSFAYHNDVQGDLGRFDGTETILFDGAEVYRMMFHGGCVGD